MNEDVVFTVQNIKSIGLSQYHKYVSEVLIDRKVSIHHPIKRNGLALFKRQFSKGVSKTKQQVTSFQK